MLNNAGWLVQLNLLDFLREIGKHFSVNEMVKRDSVRVRLEEREHGISYTEFSYMLLQAYDFLYLCEHFKCTLQMGGATSGAIFFPVGNSFAVNFGQRAEGMTFPLLTTSTGRKFGKTEDGAVWLDAARTSPYKMYQYWLQTADEDVVRYLKLFTFLDRKRIEELEAEVRRSPERREAQRVLSAECTGIVHGTEAVRAIEAASRILFSSSSEIPSEETVRMLANEVTVTEVARADLSPGISLLDLLVRTQLAESKGAARKLIESGGVYLNNVRRMQVQRRVTSDDIKWPAAILLRTGKKNYHLVRLQYS